jgi:hypothetical protein
MPSHAVGLAGVPKCNSVGVRNERSAIDPPDWYRLGGQDCHLINFTLASVENVPVVPAVLDRGHQSKRPCWRAAVASAMGQQTSGRAFAGRSARILLQVPLTMSVYGAPSNRLPHFDFSDSSNRLSARWAMPSYLSAIPSITRLDSGPVTCSTSQRASFARSRQC